MNSNKKPKRSWGLLLTEGVLIVASILLAFALDSWWDERRDRADEQVILVSLHEEFSSHKATLLRYQDYAERGFSAISAFLDAVRNGQWVSERHGPDEAIAALLIVPSADLGGGVLNALIGSGRIDLLQSQELRDRLAGWEGVFGEVRDDDELARKFAYEYSYPLLIRQGIPLSGPLGTYEIWPTEAPSPRHLADQPEMLTALLASPEVHSLLEFRLGILTHHLDEYRTAIAAVDELLTTIEGEMDRAG